MTNEMEVEKAMEELAKAIDRLCDVIDDKVILALTKLHCVREIMMKEKRIRAVGIEVYTDENGYMVFKPHRKEM